MTKIVFVVVTMKILKRMVTYNQHQYDIIIMINNIDIDNQWRKLLKMTMKWWNDNIQVLLWYW